MSREKKCPFCGGTTFEEQRIDYLYSHQGQYLLVPNTPVTICMSCDMIYYQAKVLEKIEQRFLAIEAHTETPDRFINMPLAAYA